MSKTRVLGEKAVPGMNGVRPTLLRHRDNLVDIQIGLGSGCRAQEVSLIRLANVKSGTVRFGIDRHCSDAHLAACTDDPHGNLTPVGDKNLLEHRSLLSTKTSQMSFYRTVDENPISAWPLYCCEERA